MAKEGYGFSCWKCTTCFKYPLELTTALSISKCPYCGETTDSDMVFWKCDRCGAHNDYDWRQCNECDSPR
jgi:DNA-directed RNA polymerase subunit RPC12/RpoP